MVASSDAMRPLTPAEYQKFVAGAQGHPNIKVICRLPPNLSPNYRLGYNFIYESANHGWVLDRDSDGYKLFLDLKGDGDLSHAEPLRFHDEGGVPRIDVPVKDNVTHWITRFELVRGSGDNAGIALRI